MLLYFLHILVIAVCVCVCVCVCLSVSKLVQLHCLIRHSTCNYVDMYSSLAPSLRPLPLPLLCPCLSLHIYLRWLYKVRVLYLVAMVTNKNYIREVLSVGSCDNVYISKVTCMVQRMDLSLGLKWVVNCYQGHVSVLLTM